MRHRVAADQFDSRQNANQMAVVPAANQSSVLQRRDQPQRAGAARECRRPVCRPGTAQEILEINRGLTATELQKLEGYLAHKWALTGNPPGGHPTRRCLLQSSQEEANPT